MPSSLPPDTTSGVSFVRGMHELQHEGHALRYVDRGEGMPIVFLHNGALDHWLWEHQLRHFDATHRVVAPDLLGHGRSDRPPIVYTADGFVAQVERLVDHLGLESFHLVGCCLGGGVALLYARRHPERVRSLAVVTAATPKTIASGLLGRPNQVSHPGSRVRAAAGRVCESRIGRAAMTRAFFRAQIGPVALKDRRFRERARRLYRSDGEWRVFCNSDYSGFAELDELEAPTGLPPTLVMWGGRNRMLRPAAGRELAARLRPERVEFWDDCGYMLMRERPAETNAVLAEFMSACDLSPRDSLDGARWTRTTTTTTTTTSTPMATTSSRGPAGP